MNATATSNQKVKADNHASAQSGNAAGDGIGKTYTLINGGHRLTVSVTQNGTVVNGTGAASAVGQQGDNRTAGRVGGVAAAGAGNATASSSQNVAASNQASASARSGNATGDGIGAAYVLVNGARPGSKIDLSNNGSAVNRTGDANALGQQGDNRTSGAVGQVAAGGGAGNATASSAQGVAANNRDSATAQSGNATSDGIGQALTLANGVGKGSTISVTNTGTARNTSGAATAVGQQDDNVTTAGVDHAAAGN